MKKIMILFVMLFLVFPIKINAEQLTLAENAKSAVLLEVST